MHNRFSKLWAPLILFGAFVFFAAPILTMMRFAFQNVPVFNLGWDTIFSGWSVSKVTSVLDADYFLESLWFSVKLSLITSLLVLVLLVPTAVWVHLRLPRARGLVEFLTLLPFVIPAIGLVAGIVVLKPYIRWFIASDYALVPLYLVISLPFSYRAIDTALRSLDLNTLVSASRSLGASWFNTMTRVVVPSILTAITSAMFLTIAVVLGEYTIADVLLKRTLPAFTVEYRGIDPRGGYALAVSTLIITVFLFVSLGVLSRSKRDRVESKVANDNS